MEDKQGYDGWAILELMGHVRLAGRVSEEAHFGTALGRIDIPNGDTFTTQYFGGSSIYRLTPTTEEIARSVAAVNQPEPVRPWELPKPQQIEVRADEDEDADQDDEAYEHRAATDEYLEYSDCATLHDVDHGVTWSKEPPS
jgi:hypothetical protein